MLMKGPKTMNSMDYHKKQLEYNLTALSNEIKRLYPDDQNPDFNNPKYREVVKNLAFNPILGGDLVKSLGLTDSVLSMEIWEDLSHGYARADRLSKDSPLLVDAIATPRGRMVQFRKTASAIDDQGNYIVNKDKTNRQGTEFLFMMGSNTSATLARLAIDDPTVELRFRNLAEKILKEKVMPSMLHDAQIRTGKDGVELNYAKEILFTTFMHPENRAQLPFYHFHFDLMNVALGYDDKLHTLHTDKIVANIHKHKAVFMSEMKQAMEQEFGLVFDKVYLQEDLDNEFLQDYERNIVSYDVADSFVPTEVKEFMSARQKEIDKAVKAKGKDLTPTEREYARLETRDEKSELSPSEMKAMWKKEFDTLGWTSDHVKSNLDFNQVRSNVQEIGDEQLLKNMERKVHNSATAKLQELIAKRLKGDKQPSDDALISSFIRKHKEVCFSEEQFKAHMVIQLIDTLDKETASKEAERIFSENCFQMLDKKHGDYYKNFMEDQITDVYERQQKQIRFASDVKFTTKNILQQERYISESLLARKDETGFVFDNQQVAQFIVKWENKKTEQFREKNPKAKPFKFASGQRQAVIDSLTKPGAVMNIAGRAGAGKSTLVECVRDFMLTQDLQMLGTSTSSTATNGLAESTGMKEGEFYNTTKMLQLLRKGKLKLTNKTVITVDEAGMMDMEALHDLVKFANQAGAKLLLVGEKEQLQPVNHGSSFRILNDQFGFTAVKDINRQVDDWQREMVEDLACGRSTEAIRTLYDKGRVAITDTEKERATLLVQDYLSAQHLEDKATSSIGKNGKTVMTTEKVSVDTPYNQKLIVAATNADVDMINGMVRESLQKAGKLEADTVVVQCKDKVERGFSEGDRVIFTKATKSEGADPLRVENSETGSIVGFKLDKKTNKPTAMKIRMDSGKEIFLNVDGKKPPSIRHGYCSTVHKSQGQTKLNSFYYVSQNLNSLHQAYVACSRHRLSLKIYLSREMSDNLVDKMEGREPTPSMKKVAEWKAKELGVELTPEMLGSFTQTRAFLNKTYEKFDETLAKRHATDDFSSIVESMAQVQFKKSTYDYELLEGKQTHAYKDALKYREDMLKGLVQPVHRNEPEVVVAPKPEVIKAKVAPVIPPHARTGKLKNLADIAVLHAKAQVEAVKKKVVEQVHKVIPPKKKKNIEAERTR